MTTVRFYRALMWVGTHWLARLPFSDRWGFNLGNDLDEWALMRMFRYLDRVQRASQFSPVAVTTAPPIRSWVSDGYPTWAVVLNASCTVGVPTFGGRPMIAAPGLGNG